jgi:hypothetical protein
MIDIRLPVGLLFSIIGFLLVVYGLTTLNDSVVYQKALGININLWVGSGMMVFGSAVLILSRKKRR